MKNTQSRANYEQRLSRVIAYMYDHLDDKIDLNRLAEVACMSPYHWHRVYHAMYGETIASTVKRLRMHRAAGFLVHTAMNIDEVAERSGYPNVQSFTRIFKSVFGMPPAQYRQQGSHRQFEQQAEKNSTLDYAVDIKTLPAMTALAVEHHGSYMQIGQAFEELFSQLGMIHLDSQNAASDSCKVIGIYGDDPSVIEEQDLRSWAGIVMPDNIDIPLERIEITAGPYAVLRHQGPYADMHVTYRWVYGTWLPQSGYDAANAPVIEEYLNNPRDTAPTELLTDICLPLSPDAVSS